MESKYVLFGTYERCLRLSEETAGGAGIIEQKRAYKRNALGAQGRLARGTGLEQGRYDYGRERH